MTSPTRGPDGKFLPASTSSSNLPVPVSDVKPLNQAQVKNLKAIVEGDINTLRSTIEADLDRRARARLMELEKEVGATEGFLDFRERYEQLRQDFQTQIAALDSEVKRAGFSPTMLAEGMIPVLVIRKCVVAVKDRCSMGRSGSNPSKGTL